MPEELWIEVHDIVQEAVIKTISKKKKMQKSKMVVRGTWWATAYRVAKSWT